MEDDGVGVTTGGALVGDDWITTGILLEVDAMLLDELETEPGIT